MAARCAALILLALVARAGRADAKRCKHAEWACPERDARGCCTAPKPKPAVRARVRIESAPPGAALTVDGEPRGPTPWVGELAPGEHRVVLELAGHAQAEQVVTVRKAAGQQATTIHLAALPPPPGGTTPAAAPGRLYVFTPTSRPGDVTSAVVWIDGVVQEGLAPAEYTVAPGDHRIDVQATRTPEYQALAWQGRVTVAPGQLTKVTARLRVSPRPPKGAEKACPLGMVLIPGGSFQMGSPDGEGLSWEHPQHEVQLGRYCIDWTEVTVVAFNQCSTCTERPYAPTCNSRIDQERHHHPANCVTWEQAAAYCRWAGKRLPTEAEWELAARGTAGRRYPWGDEPPAPERLNACGKECPKEHKTFDGDDGAATTAVVGRYAGGDSPYELVDMAGNVWEWVADFMGPYSAERAVDPTGPASGDAHVTRGGGWDQRDPSGFRAAARAHMNGAAPTVGFRCARAAAE